MPIGDQRLKSSHHFIWRQTGWTRCWRLSERRGTGLNRRCGDEAVVTAHDVWMILVAWNQNECTFIAVGQKSVTGNFSKIVDTKPACRIQLRAGNDKCVQVDHRSAVLPQECVRGRP